MEPTSRFLITWVNSTWAMVVDSADLFLLGLALAGVVRLLLNDRNISRFLTGDSTASVFRAALFGIPLPLCSCSVLPVAHQLRQSGAGRGATVSFLISTPESGADSILLTYSLMDPVMTVARPVVAFATAFAAGVWESRSEQTQADPEPQATVDQVACCDDGCSCQSEPRPTKSDPLLARLWSGIKYSFTDLVADLAPYLLIGYLLAGLVGTVWGAESGNMPALLRTGWGAYAGALLIGLPLYICATSSTPLAAALVAAGFSPGAALVFLIVGPATNLASIVVVRKILAGRAVIRYLVSVVVVALIGGLIVDWIYSHTGLDPVFRASEASAETAGLLELSAAVFLSALVLYYTLRGWIRKLVR